MSDSTTLIEYAKDYLQKQPFDIVHDLEHHQLVVSNCIEIIEQEKLTPNREVVLTSAWWHDVEKSYQTAKSSDNTLNFLRKAGKELNIDPGFVEQCCLTIEQHSFSQSQTTLEGKILFDADKIEYVNDARIGKLVDDFLSHPTRYQPNHLQTTHDIWVSRIKVVHDMMHFEYSKKLFLSHLKNTETVLEKLQQSIAA